MIEQSFGSFKHLSLLRQALGNHQSGILHFRNFENVEYQLNISNGDFIDVQSPEEAVYALLSGHVPAFSWQAGQVDQASGMPYKSLDTLSITLNKVQLEGVFVRALMQVFTKLPPVDIRLAPIHLSGFEDVHLFFELYQAIIHDRNFKPVDFLSSSRNNEEIGWKLRVLLLAYCQGLMIPRARPASKPAVKAATPRQITKTTTSVKTSPVQKQKSATSTTSNDKNSNVQRRQMLQRIMQRIRSI
ncbi:MAG: hypothetical protein R8K21_07660 [Mariprofundales bacterium]